MNAPISLTQRQLPDFLLRVALRRPVFVWGPPGTGKSSLVQQFAALPGAPTHPWQAHPPNSPRSSPAFAGAP